MPRIRIWRQYITVPRLFGRYSRPLNNVSDDESAEVQEFLLEDEVQQRPAVVKSGKSSHRISRLLHIFLPSFLESSTSAHQSAVKAPELHATSYLDGMRGYACFCVFVYHFVIPFHDRQDYGFAEPVDETKFDPNLVSNSWVMQLPILRLIHSGQAMVSYFFVISGFVLSHKPIKFLRAKRWDAFYHSMASAIFRRGIRLLTPMIAATAIPWIAIQLGLYELVRGYNPGLPRRMTFLEQTWDWMSQTAHQMNFLSSSNEIFWNDYGGQTWTILVELKGSYTLFLVVIATSRAKTIVRLAILIALCCYSVRIGLWETFCFISGIFLAEIDHIRQSSASNDNTEDKKQKLSVFSIIKWSFVFILGLWMLSSPNSRPDLTPGFKFLNSYNPLWTEHNRFFHIIGSMLLILSVGNCVHLQPMFTNFIAQYLGQISFALYLVHFVLVDTVGYAILNIIWSIFGSDTVFKYEFGWCLSFLLLAIGVIWLADLFWRGIDLKSVTLSRWLERKMCYTVA